MAARRQASARYREKNLDEERSKARERMAWCGIASIIALHDLSNNSVLLDFATGSWTKPTLRRIFGLARERPAVATGKSSKFYVGGSFPH
ncbi:hypothetical protein B0H14DRAFT_3480336 [Mycena olivaceomarginata]|nr:hypothetical protein B0H14DRAFT_3480336 [Mycena olivaceomarginata]